MRTPIPEVVDELSLVLGERGTPFQRFAWAWSHRAAGTFPSLKSFARALGVHPTALSPSNFKLPPSARAQAGILLGLDPRFLQDGIPPDDALPPALHGVLAVVQDLYRACREAYPCTAIGAWSMALAVRSQHPAVTAAVAKVVAAHGAAAVDPVWAALVAHATRILEQQVPITVTLGDLAVAVDALVEESLRQDEGALLGARLRLAKRWHNLVASLEAPL